MLNKYKFKFDYRALIFFAIMMAPTIFWSFVKAPNDILRAESVTPVIDTIATISQVIMIAALCMLRNEKVDDPKLTPLMVASLRCLIGYYFGWVLYYCGVANPAIIIVLSLIPCISFLLYSIDRKNIVAIISTIVFLICHLIFAVVNFII